MKKKMWPLFYAGLGLNVIGFALMYVFADMQHNWIPIPVFVLGSALLVIYGVKSRQG